MHPVRRRKKRPNYGVRSVDVQRGKNGFGFTISGQQPCILSCIVPGSPAENAGLRAGDYLVAVGGHSVSKMRHNDVVQLIGNTSGILKLQIAENYYSDSSDDDMIAIRHKPKYPHKLKSCHNPRTGAAGQNRVAKVVRDLTSGAMFDESLVEVSMSMPNSTPSSNSKSAHKSMKWKAPAHLLPPLPRLYFSEPLYNRTKPEEDEQEMFRAIVGYLGTIEMPRKLPPGSRLQIVRGCIKRLRAEKRTHTAVLMTLFTRSLKLQNHSGTTLAVYPGDRVTFCGASSNEDRRHFGVVTTSTGDDPSDSCHVFVVDPRPHSEHSFRSLTFKVECTIDPNTGFCQEFPINCDPILAIIKKFYETPGVDDDEPVANSPQPSHDSTTTTSNSDSGIGFRDDSGNQSDRILVVDIQNQRLHIQPNGEMPCYPSRERLTVRAMPDPVVTSASNRSYSPISTCSEDPFNLRVSQENMSVSSGKSSRKTPDVSSFENSTKPLDNSAEKGSRSVENGFMFSNIDNHNCSADDMSLGTCSSKSQDAFLSYKLSPKVFGFPANTSQSLEDLKVHKHTNLKLQDSSMSNSCNLLRSTTLLHPAHWGSLQDLRSIANDCFEDSPSIQKTHENSENGVTSWTASFEKLLEDPAGLHTFAEFLKKEFSHENIYFWAACERYRLQESLKKRQEMAREIFDKHLALRAPEPVNVDSQARQVTQEQLDIANEDLFLQAQKQIFNLMKFDSYPRFLKSEQYKECLLCEISGLPLFSPCKMDPALEIHRSSTVMQTPKLKKSHSDADDRRRKSLLPWSRSRSRCKSRDRMSIAGSTEQDKDAVSTSSSRWSLASWDLALSSNLCRVILPDDATAVVQVKPDQTIRQMIIKLLDKRALNYNCFQVFVGQSTKALSLDESSSIVGGQELRMEPRVVFRLDLPNKKTIAVKSKQCKTLEQVLRPILKKYGYRFEMCTLCLMSENQVLEPDMAVSTVDNQRLQVLTRSTPIPTTSAWKDSQPPSVKQKCGPTLDEITNRVFEELLQGKSEKSRTVSDQGSVRSEEWSSEHSSSILGRFMRRDSVVGDKNGDIRQKTKKAASVDGSEKKSSAVSRLPPLIAKWKSSSKPDGRSESDVLYEGLKRAQRSRLEDQRGTEINFELPDFLKDKENAPQGSNKKIRKIRATEDSGDSRNIKAFSTEGNSEETSETPSLKLGEVKKVLNTQLGTRYIDSGFIDGILPSPSRAEEYFVNGNNSVIELNSRLKTNPSPLVQSNGINSSCLNESHILSRLSDIPPPLPPKPKNLSSMNPWPAVSNPDPKPDLKTCRMRKALYLDQPNGSFV